MCWMESVLSLYLPGFKFECCPGTQKSLEQKVYISPVRGHVNNTVSSFRTCLTWAPRLGPSNCHSGDSQRGDFRSLPGSAEHPDPEMLMRFCGPPPRPRLKRDLFSVLGLFCSPSGDFLVTCWNGRQRAVHHTGSRSRQPVTSQIEARLYSGGGSLRGRLTTGDTGVPG